MRIVILPRVAAPPGGPPTSGGTTTRVVQFPHKSPHKSQSGNSCFEAQILSHFGKSHQSLFYFEISFSQCRIKK